MWSYTNSEQNWLNDTVAVEPAKSLGRLRQIWTTVETQLGKWERRSRERAWLAQMSDRELQDLRLSRHEAEVEASKPFWRP